VLTLVGLLASVIQYYKAPDPIVLGTIIGGMLAYWAAVAWWWTKRRTRPSYASTGMKTAVALLLAAVLLLSAAFLNELRWQGRIHEALLDASDSQQVVAAAYQQVTQGAETEQVQANFTESARADMAALQKRAAAGELDSYETHGLGLPDSPFARAMRWDHSPSHTVLVEVWEYDRVGDFTPYVYRVSEIDLPPVNGVGQSTLRIESVERKDFPSESTSGDAEAVISVF